MNRSIKKLTLRADTIRTLRELSDTELARAAAGFHPTEAQDTGCPLAVSPPLVAALRE